MHVETGNSVAVLGEFFFVNLTDYRDCYFSSNNVTYFAVRLGLYT